MSETRLKQIGEERVVEFNPPQPDGGSALDKAAMEMLLLGLKTLSQRTLVALSNLFTLLTAFSVFWLWYITLPQPNIYQLVGLTLYGIFVLVLHCIRRKP